MTIRLSICIATYNRAAFIGETLDSILPQLTDECEVVIIDGASTDSTPDVLAPYAQKCPQLRYIRLQAKGGIDKDYDLSVQHAQGEYCWLFSDDDLIKAGGIQKVLGLIQDHPSLIIVNAEVRNADLQELQQRSVGPMTADKIYAPDQMEAMLVELGNYMSFIGCIVIRRDIWTSRERDKYYGLDFIHVGVIFQLQLPGNAMYVADPLIIIRFGNASWSARAFNIWTVQWPKMIWGFPQFSDAAKRAVTRKEPHRSKVIMLMSRAQDGLDRKSYEARWKPLLNHRRDRVFAKLITYTPATLVNLAMLTAYKILRPNLKLIQGNLRESRAYYRNAFPAIFSRNASSGKNG